MCGIVGIYGFDGGAEPLAQRLTTMSQSMTHRGPDSDGLHTFPDMRAGLSIRRLSIVDPQGGSQPLFNEDKSIAVVCNGEIYNHLSLRRELEQKGYRFRSRSDCEVIAHLYQEEGPAFVQRLNGMFALAVLDRRDRSLLIARDPVGMKHLYWAQTGQGLAFASEARALFATGLVSPQPDWDALGNYFSVGWVPSPRTAFKGLQRLQPGSYLRLDPGGTQQLRYWSPSYERPPGESSEAEYAHELKTLLDAAVQSHLQGDVPAGLFVSGGWDSSLVALYASRHSGEPLKSFSLVFPDDPASDESRFSRQVAEHVGALGHEVEIRDADALGALQQTSLALEEPLITSAPLLGFLLSGTAAEHVKFVLGGEGADELFAGYSRYRDGPLDRLRKWLPHQLLPASLPFEMRPQWRRTLGFLGAVDDEQAHLQWLALSSPSTVASLLRPGIPLGNGPGPEAIGITDETRRSLRDGLDLKLSLELTGRLADGILFGHDKTSMAHSLEVRMPFLDREVIQFAHRLPSSFKIRDGQMKALLSPLAQALPADVAQRSKQGLHLPKRIFRCRAIREFYRETILETSLSSGIFRHKRLESWVTKLASQPDDRALGLYPLCHFCLWWNNFVG